MSGTEEKISTLVDMGFDRDEASLALRQAHGDVETAINILSSGDFENGDNEFDLIELADIGPSVQDPTVFYPRTEATGPDHFREGGDTVEEMLDSRIASLVSMGFSATDASNALKRCNNDVNEALNLLLSSA